MSIIDFFSNRTWLFNMITFITGSAFIATILLKTYLFIKFKLKFKIDKNKTDYCALSIGLGSKDPYVQVVQYLNEENKDKIISYYKSHKSNPNDFLTKEEIQRALIDIRKIIRELQHRGCGEVLVFYAGPYTAAMQIGYLFKNSSFVVKFIQFNLQTKKYEVMVIPES